jgi:predicted nuclease with TOPRIM domain
MMPPSNKNTGVTPEMTTPNEPSLSFPKELFTSFLDNYSKIATTQLTGFAQRVSEYEDAIMKLSTQFGGGREFAETMRASFAKAEFDVKSMGGTFEDMVDIQEAANESMGGTAMITSEGMKQIYASVSMVEGGLKVSKENAKSLIENFTKAGMSIYNIGTEVNKIMNVAKESGANAKLVFDEIEKNMGKLNLFNFKNGVEGMAKMASESQKLRISMDDTLKIADSLFDPEKAVEMASAFQRFGMGSLTNVYELQDIARNDPGKLQEMLGKEFQRFVTIDEKTGERTINAMGQEVIRVLSKEIPGLSTDYIMNAGLAMAEFNDKVKKIELPDWASDQASKDLIYRQAQLGEKGTEMEGRYVINIDGVARDISTLTKEESEKLKTQIQEQKQPNQDIIEAQRSSQHEIMKLNNTLTALHSFYPSLLASNSKVNDALMGLGKNLNEFNKKSGGLFETMGVKAKQREGKGGERYDVTGAYDMTNKMSDLFIGSMSNTVTTLAAKIAADPTILGDPNKINEILKETLYKPLLESMPEINTTEIFNAVTGLFGNLGTLIPQNANSNVNVNTNTSNTSSSSAIPSSNLNSNTNILSIIQPEPLKLIVDHNFNAPSDLDRRIIDVVNNNMGELLDNVQEGIKKRGRLWMLDFK